MATLTISHYLYLTKEQRYQLHERKPIEVIGISVPVWFNKGSTSEPAKEIFCRYQLTNDSVNRNMVTTDEGYNINIPQNVEVYTIEPITATHFSTSEQLLDFAEGGVEFLEFKQYNKIQKKMHKFNVVHFVEIKTVEKLLETLN